VFQRDPANIGKNWIMAHYDTKAEESLDRVLFHAFNGGSKASGELALEEEKHSKLMGFFRSCVQHFGETTEGGIMVKATSPEKGVDSEHLRLLDTIDAVENWADLSRVFGVLSVRSQHVPFELHLHPGRIEAKGTVPAHYDIHQADILACPSGWVMPPEEWLLEEMERGTGNATWSPLTAPSDFIKGIIEQEGCASGIGGSSDALARAYITVSQSLWRVYEDSKREDAKTGLLYTKVPFEEFKTRVIERSGVSLTEYIRGMEEEMAFAAFSWKTSLHRFETTGIRMETRSFFENNFRLDKHDLFVWKNYLRAGLCLQTRTTRISPELEQSEWYRRARGSANACSGHTKTFISLKGRSSVRRETPLAPVDSLCAKLTSAHMAHVINRYIYGDLKRTELSPFSEELDSVKKLFALVIDNFKSSVEEHSNRPLRYVQEWNATATEWVRERLEHCTLHLAHMVHEEVGMARLRMSYSSSFRDNVLHAKGFDRSVVLVDAPKIYFDHMHQHLDGGSLRDKATAETGPWMDLFLRPRLWKARFEYLQEWNAMLVSPIYLDRPVCDSVSVSPLLKRRGSSATASKTLSLSLASTSRIGYMLTVALSRILEPSLDRTIVPTAGYRRQTLRSHAQKVHHSIYTDKAKEESSKIWHERTSAGLEEASLTEASERDAIEASLYDRQNINMIECGCIGTLRQRGDDNGDEEDNTDQRKSTDSEIKQEYIYNSCQTLLISSSTDTLPPNF
jgi:hypothetical protein